MRRQWKRGKARTPCPCGLRLPQSVQGLAAFSIAFSAAGVPMLTVCFGISFETAVFDLDGRNRRPPRDPINALLSFAYNTVIFALSLNLLLGLLG